MNNEQQIDAIYKDLKIVIEGEKEFRDSNIEERAFEKKWLSCAIACAVLCIITAYTGDYFNLFAFKVMGISFLAATIGCTVYYNFKLAFGGTGSLKSFLTKPFTDSVETRLCPLTKYMHKHISLLLKYPLDTLEITRAALLLEYKNFPRRSGMFIGAIEAVGLLPAVLALLVALSSVGYTSLWVFTFAICYLFFVVLALFIQHEAMRYSRLIKLIDLAILEKNKEAN